MTVYPFLVSFAYFGDKYMEQLEELTSEHSLDVMADSGAYSIMTAQQDRSNKSFPDLTVHSFAEWLLKWRHVFNVYVNLDVFHDPIGSAENLRILETEYGLTPMPVFHMGVDYGHLKDILDQGHKYIGLGGIAGGLNESHFRHFIKSMVIAEEYEARFHVLGRTTPKFLRKLPFRSCDSHSWSSGGMYGWTIFFDRSQAKMVQVPTGRKSGTDQAVAEHADLIRQHGWDPYELVGADWRVLNGIGSTAMRTMAQWASRHHGKPVTIYNVSPNIQHLRTGIEYSHPTLYEKEESHAAAGNR